MRAALQTFLLPIFTASLLACHFAYSDDEVTRQVLSIESVGAAEETPQVPVMQEETALACKQEAKSCVTLRGIVIVRGYDATRVDLDDVRGVYVDASVNIPSDSCHLESALKPFLNKPIDRDTLVSIKREILGYYSCRRQHVLSVEIPEQEITSGVVVFDITYAQVGDVTYRGNCWFPQKQVEKGLCLRPGVELDEGALLNDLAWLNQNPFHHTEAILSPGSKPGQTDVEVVTQDRFPVRFYVGGENTGVESTGRSRYSGGVTWGNAFFADDILTYQFTSNSTYNKFHSHLLDYVAFLPSHHILSVFGAYAEIHPDIKDFRNDGKDAQASLRYKVPLNALYTNFQHQVYCGFDYKYMTSILFFVGEVDFTTPEMNSQVNVFQLVLGYGFEYTSPRNRLAVSAEIVGSPTRFLPHQRSKDYNALREDSDPQYFYCDFSLNDTYTFSTGDSLDFRFRFQGSASTLIPSEQFALGGYNTVRGYEQCVFISDSGICANLELRSRPFSFLKKCKDELTLLAFMDYGWGYNYHQFDGIGKANSLWGVGPGVRYNIHPNLNIRVDYGFKLRGVKFDDNPLGMWHVGASLSY